MKALFITLGLLSLPLTTQAADGLFKQLTLPSGQVITVSEGRGEPASTGSYDVRLYSGANPEFPLDQFIDGKVLPRDGSIKELKLQDLNGDKQPELIVIVESAGSGSYRSADAFTINPQEGLDSFNHVEGLAPGEDLIQALKTPRD
ncbi:MULTISPECIES: PliI family lysozyme inhibitor of I-type lysozyme [Aeromonas]|uniref:PliI family lysozyme inhibitor of I-type lysozyme n=1 Tax=Aeromonas eucrenophila TaxID=649 RepID=A0ABW0Y9Z1_9GAMM|nr:MULTISPECIES: PliI family lysozyme inhibitor of I-type lysozyme [Aeromonas]MCH7370385.1 PliI family lysozyme inhibitor of I-type lysozyme [Aeromonas sp. MR16]